MEGQLEECKQRRLESQTLELGVGGVEVDEGVVEKGNLASLNNTSTSVQSMSEQVKTQVTFRDGRIAQEKTLFSSMIQIVFCVWSKKWVASTAKDFK